MAQRLSLGAFAVHGMEIKPFKTNTWPLGKEKTCLGEFEKNLIRQTFWTDTSKQTPIYSQIKVIEYSDPKAGAVAIQVRTNDQAVVTYYPIKPNGGSDILEYLRNQFGQEYVTINRAFTDNSDQLTWANII